MKNRSKMGRPSSYTPELAEELLFRLSEGETLTAICRDAHMPNRSTIYDWADGLVDEVPDDFPSRYTRAKRRQAYTYEDEIIEIADCNAYDLIEKKGANGVYYEAFNFDWYNRNKLMIETRKYHIDRILGGGKKAEEESERKVTYVNAPPQAQSYEEWKQSIE